MKLVAAFVFCFYLFHSIAYAQFKNITLATRDTVLDLAITANAKNTTNLFVTGQSFIYSSEDKGLSWKKEDQLSLTDIPVKSNRQCLGPKNEVYKAFADGDTLKFEIENKSSRPTIIAPFKHGQRYFVQGKILANGLPSIACDLSKGEHHARIYVCWSDEKYGESNKDVFLAYSDDEGTNWTEPIIVTYRPNHKEQFMPCMTIDQSTGFIYIVYYDQQNSSDGSFADVYLAQSKNGGLLFDYYKINQAPVNISNGQSLGNRCGLVASASEIRPVWVQPVSKKKRSVITAIIDENNLATYHNNTKDNLAIEKTFVFSDTIKINFDLKVKTSVTALLTNPLDHTFEKLIIKNKMMKKGHNSLFIDAKKMGVPKGNYTLTLYYDHKNTYVWIVEE